MIALYTFFVIVGLVVFLVCYRLRFLTRVMLAIGVFLVLSIAATVWVFIVGDRALPGSVTIYP